MSEQSSAGEIPEITKELAARPQNATSDAITNGSSGYECVRCLEAVARYDLSDIQTEGGWVCKQCAAQPEDLRLMAKKIISMESACIEWGASSERSVSLVVEQLAVLCDSEKAFAAERIREMEEALEAATTLIEQAYSAVSHGGPTRADAERVMKQARAALNPTPKEQIQ